MCVCARVCVNVCVRARVCVCVRLFVYARVLCVFVFVCVGTCTFGVSITCELCAIAKALRVFVWGAIQSEDADTVIGSGCRLM